MEMASFCLKICHVFADISLTERSIGAGPPVIIQLSGANARDGTPRRWLVRENDFSLIL